MAVIAAEEKKPLLGHMRVELDGSVDGFDGVHLGGAQASFRSDVRTELIGDLPRLEKSRRIAYRRRFRKIYVVVFGQHRLNVRVKLQ